MKSLIEFLQTKDVEKSSIFEHLKCNKTEAVVLQYLAKKYMDGQDDILIRELLQNCMRVMSMSF